MMDNIFPESKIDPTAELPEMSVEQTLRICGHVQRMTKTRNWRYLTGPQVTIASIREFYGASDAPVFSDGDEHAVWVGDGTPDPIGGPFAPLAPSRVPGAGVQSSEAGSWRYTACMPKSTEDEIRKKLGADEDAPVRFHSDGDLAAAWFGGEAPTKPAFPGIGNKPREGGDPSPTTSDSRGPDGHYVPAEPEAWLGTRGIRHNPGLAGRDGIRLLKLSRNKALSKKTRALLERVALRLEK